MKVKQLCEEYLELKNKNLLLIGDNGSAKTYILEKILKDCKKKDEMYYIAEINKRITFDETPEKEIKIVKIEEITKKRLNNNKSDSVISGVSGDIYFGVIYNWKIKNTPLSHYIKKYFESDIKLPVTNKYKGETTDYEFIETETGRIIKHKVLSTGYQGIFRIILEVIHAVKIGAKYIFIDELCKNLDTSNAYKLMRYLESGLIKETYKINNKNLAKELEEVKFVITTHSSAVIQGAEDFNIVHIKNTAITPDDKELDVYYAGNYKDDISIKRKFFPNDAVPTNTKIDEKWLNDLYDRVVTEGEEITNKEKKRIKDYRDLVNKDSEEYELIEEILEEVGE